MKKFGKLGFTTLILSTLLFGLVKQSFALVPIKEPTILQKPSVQNDMVINFDQLPKEIQEVKKIIDNYLIVSTRSYGTKYTPSEKYNQIVEKQLILLIKETYSGNEKIYEELFKPSRYYNNTFGLKELISSIPKGYKAVNISSILYNKNTVTNSLLDSSFGIGYSNSTNYNSLINTIRRQIENFKRTNAYYPSLVQLGQISVFRNRENIKISEIMDDFEYNIISGDVISETKRKEVLDKLKENVKFSRLNLLMIKEISDDIIKLENNLDAILAKQLAMKYDIYNKKTYDRTFNDMKKAISDIYFGNDGFELKYKHKTFSLEEAKNQLDKVGTNEIEYKDYKKLIGENKIENIPEVYKIIPNNSIFFHVNNPEFLFDLLEDNENYDNSGVEVLKKVRDFIVEKAGTPDFDEIKKSIKNDFVVVISDIDLVSPNILIILNKKDKGFLGVVDPGSKAKVTVTKGDHILITTSKDLLDQYLELDEKDSIYNSDDFKYVWMKKQNIKKDIFFFAGDKFFEKLISVENYIKMKRKINDYFNLSELQSFVFAFEKIEGNKINDFNELNKILEIDQDELSEYEVKNSIVKSKKIGKIDDIKNIDEVNYNLDEITREELESYKENILNYREVWRGSLDPLGIIFTGTNNGFETDFFMTPIPDVKDNNLNLFKVLFENIGIEKLDFMENKNLRIGTIGGILGFDTEEIEKKISSFSDKKETNRDLYYLSRAVNEFNDEVLGGKNIFDYFDGEIMLSLGGLEKSIFTSYNTEKLDAFLAIEFKSKLKAKEFVKIVKDKIAEEFSRGGNSFEDKLTQSLMKPLSEDYNGELIYIIPEIDLYFIKPSFYYTIIDKYFYISLSKNSVKKTIDFYKEPGNIKQKFIDNSLEGNKTLFMFLDSDKLKGILDEMTSEDSLTDLYLEVKTGADLGEINLIKHQIGIYYSNLEYNKLLGKETKDFNETFGILDLKTNNEEVFLTINKDKLNIKNEELKTEILSMFNDLDAKYFTKEGGEISPLLKDGSFNDLFAVASFDMILNKSYRDNFFKNMTSYIDMSDNEIQIKFNSFSNKTEKPSAIIESIKESLGISNDEGNSDNGILYIIIGFLSSIILLGWIFVIKNKKVKK